MVRRKMASVETLPVYTTIHTLTQQGLGQDLNFYASFLWEVVGKLGA